MFVDDICTSENTRRFSTGGSPVGHYTVPLKSYDLNFKQNRPVPVRCVQSPVGRRPGHRTVHGRCYSDYTYCILNDPTKCRTGAV